MYGKSAKYYDPIYSWKNYKRESDRLHSLIRRYKLVSGKHLLDVACGTGSHISYLKRWYKVEGLDVNREMLEQARRKHPGVKFYRKDMSHFHLDKQFDVITCLFSAIGFVKTKTKLRKTISTIADHLKAGGVALVEPWFSPSQWSGGRLSANFVNQTNLKVARISISERRGRLSVNDEHHLVGTSLGVEYFVERLELGLFTMEDYEDAFRRAKLRVRHDREGLMGRGLYIGVKPLG